MTFNLENNIRDYEKRTANPLNETTEEIRSDKLGRGGETDSEMREGVTLLAYSLCYCYKGGGDKWLSSSLDPNKHPRKLP